MHETQTNRPNAVLSKVPATVISKRCIGGDRPGNRCGRRRLVANATAIHGTILSKVEAAGVGFRPGSGNGRNQSAHGHIIRIFGRVLSSDGLPVEGARVEIWQANAFGRYAHLGDTSSAPLDPNFQGFGKLATNADGAYQFRTVKSAPYSNRTPHVHFRVSRRNFRMLTTQIYFPGETRNEHDFLLRRIQGDALRRRVITNFQHIPQIPADELAGNFDIVVERS